MKKNPLVSIIIVNFNGRKWLKTCLTSLLNQTYTKHEIILVDNASTDDSVNYVLNNFKKVKLIKNKKNLGFAGGNNLGYQKAKGEYILFINNDTKVKKDYLSKFVNNFDKYSNAGIIQSKLVIMDNTEKIDSCGSYWTDTSFLYYIGNSKDSSLEKYNKPFKVFSVKGASMIVKRKLIDKIGLFDEKFWNYYEETDLCHRALIVGYEVWYDPSAICYHAMGGTSLTFNNDFIQFHNFKNKLRSIIKNFSVSNALIYSAAFLFFNILIGLMWIFKGKIKHSFSLVKAVGWNIANLTDTLKERHLIQNRRVVSDNSYLSKLKVNPKLNYFYFLLIDRLDLYKDH